MHIYLYSTYIYTLLFIRIHLRVDSKVITAHKFVRFQFWHSTDFNRITESVQDKLSMFKVCVPFGLVLCLILCLAACLVPCCLFSVVKQPQNKYNKFVASLVRQQTQKV